MRRTLEAEFEAGDEEPPEPAKTDAGADETSVSSSGSKADEAETTQATSGSTDVKASPKAKRRAEELGVDLTTVDGTGPQDAITTDDVKAAADAPTTATADTAEKKLHPQVEDLLHELSEAGVPPLYRLSIEEARETYRDLAVPEGEPEPVNQVIDTEIDGPNGSIPIRVYLPASETDGTCEYACRTVKLLRTARRFRHTVYQAKCNSHRDDRKNGYNMTCCSS